MLTKECKQELEGRILPFWKNLIDQDNGGYYGYMDANLRVDEDAPKGVILNSRILWFFSNCYLTIGGEENLAYATHAYRFLAEHCYDKEQGGVYWMMSSNGTVREAMKHTYNHAFAVYALASYYDASKDEKALKLAFDIFNTIEEKTTDEIGYKEAFTRNWVEIENDALSENGLMAQKTMNTMLHLLEAYTELLRVKRDARVEERLRALLTAVQEKVFDDDTACLRVFFDRELQVIGDIHSYGHDIEAAWLIDRACEVLDDKAVTAACERMTLRIAENISKLAIENGALNNERDGAHINKDRIWWVQAEGIVGYLNAYQHCGNEAYLSIAQTLWTYIKGYLLDKREGGEWYWLVDFEGKPSAVKPIVEPWKCPYHNGRMCLEVIKRNID